MLSCLCKQPNSFKEKRANKSIFFYTYDVLIIPGLTESLSFSVVLYVAETEISFGTHANHLLLPLKLKWRK